MLEDFTDKHNLRDYRISQFNKGFYQEGIKSFSELTTWPEKLRTCLEEEVGFSTLEPEKKLVSKSGDTVKVLFKRHSDDQRIEAVLIRHRDGRNTVCVSCMVGCPVNCSFCATGKMGFGGNLSAREIIDQVLYFQRRMKKQQRITNVVFMGMGEPMLNLENVMESIDILTDQGKMGMSMRRITVSTSGYIPQLMKLIEYGFRGRIAISLHAPNQKLRAKMMPVAKIYGLEKLMDALDEYVELTNKRVSYEYILIQGINDRKKHARQLVELLKNRLAHVNLIPYNPIREVPFARTGKIKVDEFRKVLDAGGIENTLRVTMGADVEAACGQLADRENRRNISRRIRN